MSPANLTKINVIFTLYNVIILIKIICISINKANQILPITHFDLREEQKIKEIVSESNILLFFPSYKNLTVAKNTTSKSNIQVL